MGILTSPLCCAVKCCGCIILSQLIGLLMSIGMLVLFIAAFYFFILPWGERKIISELGLPSGTDFDAISASTIAAQNCSGCVFGTNTEWPTTTTGSLHFLDTTAGTTISSVVATSLVATAAAGAGTMLWASAFPSLASAMSFAGGFYEMTHILEQAQYIGMIGQLQLRGSPEFLTQVSKELAWTNFNLPKSVTEKFLPSRRLDLTDTVADTASAAVQPKFDGETGPAKYAKTLGVDAKDLFFYTLKVFAAVVVVIHVMYIVFVMVVSCVSKKLTFSQHAAKWYRKVIWAVLLALLLAQYIFAMTGSYFIYENMRSNEPRDSNFVLACVLLVAAVGFAIIFGIAIIANNTDELKDIGTVEHDDRPFAAKYSAYYDEYNFDNRFFFVPRILLAVSTGVVVGVVQDPTKQLFFVLGVTFLYLLLIIMREPNLLRFLYYIGLASVFMKVVLVCMMLVLVQDDFFPQNVRDKVAYAIIGINIFIFFLLFLRQAYIIIYKIVRGCKNKGTSNGDDDDDDARRHAIEEANRTGRYERLNSNGGAHGTRNGGFQNDPYAQSQQYKEQSFLAGQQQQPYGRSDPGIQGGAAGAAAGNAASGQYSQQQHRLPTSSADMYGQPGGARGAPMNQNGYGADPHQSGGDGYRYGSGAERGSGAQGGRGSAQTGYGANNANNGRPQGRSITDRYLGIEPESAAAVGAGVAVGAAAAHARGSQQNWEQPAPAVKPEPEKYTWRRNMERRAAESAAAEEAARPRPPRHDSLLRFDSDDSYGTESRFGDSGRALTSNNTAAAYSDDRLASRSSSPRQRHMEKSFATESTDDWFNQRAPSDVGSYASALTFGRSDDLAASSLAPGSSRGDDDMNSSFMSADSYSSNRQGTMMDSQRSLNSALDDSSSTGIVRTNTHNLDNLAVAYLEKAGGGTGATENDIGDDDDEEDEGVAPLLDFPKAGDTDDDKDETESVDIDAAPDSDEEEDDDDEKPSGKDIDVDVDDDRASVDIDDESDEDVDIDAITSHDKNAMTNTMFSDELEDRDSYSNIKQLDDIRDSYMSASSDGGYVRQMSEVSLRSDDDASFYLEGRQNESPSTAERQKEREKTAGPLKL